MQLRQRVYRNYSSWQAFIQKQTKTLGTHEIRISWPIALFSVYITTLWPWFSCLNEWAVRCFAACALLRHIGTQSLFRLFSCWPMVGLACGGGGAPSYTRPPWTYIASGSWLFWLQLQSGAASHLNLGGGGEMVERLLSTSVVINDLHAKTRAWECVEQLLIQLAPVFWDRTLVLSFLCTVV